MDEDEFYDALEEEDLFQLERLNITPSIPESEYKEQWPQLLMTTETISEENKAERRADSDSETEGVSADLELRAHGEGDNREVNVSRYQSRLGSVHPLEGLVSSGLTSLNDSVSDMEKTATGSVTSSGALSASLSIVMNESGGLANKPHKIRVKVKAKNKIEFGCLMMIQELKIMPVKRPPSIIKPSSRGSSVGSLKGSNQLGDRSPSVESASSSIAKSTAASEDTLSKDSPSQRSNSSGNIHKSSLNVAVAPGRRTSGNGLRKTPSPLLVHSTSPALFTARFSYDGNLLAVAGDDGLIRIWKLIIEDTMAAMAEDKTFIPPKMLSIFQEEPIQILEGHESAVLDLCWSKNNFLLSSSMDKTVRLWHYSRSDCLGIFKHPDFVTSVAFHPRDDRMFISGSLDCRIRLWSIADKSVKQWNELPANNYITAVNFSSSGRLVFAGTSTGVCLIFETEILISTNDSRVRLYTLKDKSVILKFIGHTNQTSQIKATFSDDGEYIISGSEDNRIYIWNVENRHQTRGLFTRTPRHHVKSCEYFQAHSKTVTSAIFAPSSVRNRLQSVGLRPVLAGQAEGQGQIILAVDLNGKIKVYENSELLESWLAS